MDGPTMSCEFCDKVHQIWPKIVLDSIVMYLILPFFLLKVIPSVSRRMWCPQYFQLAQAAHFPSNPIWYASENLQTCCEYLYRDIKVSLV